MEIRKEIRHNLVKPYKHRKKLFDLKTLESKIHIKRSYLLIGLSIIILFIINKRYFLFGLLTAFSFVFSYYHSKYNRTPLDFKMALFLGMYVTREYGMILTMLFFLLTDIMPAILGGESVNGPDLFFFAWYFIVNSFILLFPNVPMTTIGPMLVIVHDLGAIYINSKVGGIPGYVSFAVSFMTSIVRIIYFLTLGRVLDILFSSV